MTPEQPLPGFEYYKNCFLKNYANFDGRARRAEFWNFILFNFIANVIIYGLVILGGTMDIGILASIGGILSLVYALAAFVPNLAVSARRLHDVGKSGWFMLLALIPLVGLIVLYHLVQDGEHGSNQYGPNPKYKSSNDDVINHIVA